MAASASVVSACTSFLTTHFAASSSCVVGGTYEECARMVRDNMADVTAPYGGDNLYTAGTKYGLTPVVSQQFAGMGNEIGATYYSVAIVNKNDAVCSATNGFAALRVRRHRRRLRCRALSS